MSDLDKLMKKLKTDEPVKAEVVAQAPAPAIAPAPVQAPAPLPVTQVGEIPTPAIDDDDDDEDEPEALPQAPAQAPAPEENAVEHEVAVLQNNGVFRREMLLIEKEKVDVLKVIAQTILDIKAKLTA